MDSELLLKCYWVFPRLPFSIVAYAFTRFLDSLCRNSCMLLCNHMLLAFSIGFMNFVISFRKKFQAQCYIK